MKELLILICLVLTLFIMGYYLMYWFMIFLLAIINSDAQYDNTSKKAILELAKKDKIWKDVALLLDLEREVN